MILKASRRSGAKQLADHLLNAEQNEHVEVQEVRGFMSDDLGQAFNEVHAHAQANQRIKKFLFSMSINPPKGQTASKQDMVDAANEAEERLGLQNQPRVIVFHEKEGRRHAHAVWSRVDENIKAIKLDYFKNTLTDLSRDLYLKHGWDLPKGLQNRKERDRTNYSLSEHQAAKRHNLNPKEVKAEIQACWHETSDTESFIEAIEQSGFTLAKGDKRSFVLVDGYGEVRSLSRTLSIKVRYVKERLGDQASLPSVEEANARLENIQAQPFTKSITSRLDALERNHSKQLAPLKAELTGLSKEHKEERKDLNSFHDKRQDEERAERQVHYQNGLKGLWQFVTGRYHALKVEHQAEYEASLKRDAHEKEALVDKQLHQRETLQDKLQALRTKQQSECLMVMRNLVAQEHEIETSQHIQEPELAL
jgi:hypothetical protein